MRRAYRVSESIKITGEDAHNSTEQGVHLGLPESGKVERGVVLSVTGVVEADEPGDEGLS